MMHEMHNQKNNIDVLFLGSSHTYRSLDTSVTDRIFRANTFNAGSSGQSPDGSYTLLREAARKNKIKKVYMEMYFHVMGETYNDRTELTSTYIISDYLDPSFLKLNYILNASSDKYWMNGLVPGRRYWKDIFSHMYISNILTSKSKDNYINYAYPAFDDEWYAGKGYVANLSRVENEGFSGQNLPPIKENEFSDDDKKYLTKIIKFCNNNNIQLTLFSSPIPNYTLVSVGNYDDYISQVKNFADQYGVEYYDFNLLKESYFSGAGDLFKDNDHLNEYGAEKFSKIFSEFFSGEIPEERLFYQSYSQKVRENPSIYGINYNIKNSGDGEQKIIELKAVKTSLDDVVATVQKNINNESQLVYEYSNLTEITTSSDESGSLTITLYNVKDKSTPTNIITIPY